MRRHVESIRIGDFFLNKNPRPDSESSASNITVAQDELVETLNPASIPAGLSSQILGVSGAPYLGLSGMSVRLTSILIYCPKSPHLIHPPKLNNRKNRHHLLHIHHLQYSDPPIKMLVHFLTKIFKMILTRRWRQKTRVRSFKTGLDLFQFPIRNEPLGDNNQDNSDCERSQYSEKYVRHNPLLNLDI